MNSVFNNKYRNYLHVSISFYYKKVIDLIYLIYLYPNIDFK